METCEIQWIDSRGNPTPDTRPAVVVIQCIAHNNTINGRVIHFDASREFRCCAEHLRQMDGQGMEHWRVVASLQPWWLNGTDQSRP